MSPTKSPAIRTAWVPATRLVGWVERFGLSHGTPVLTETDPLSALHITTPDGTSALLTPPWPVDGRPGRGDDALSRLTSLASQSRTVAVLLIRRGGYAVGICRDGKVIASKVGSRYVQSRTAAGGWSQQRFARRRANQADAMIEAVAGHAALLPADGVEYVLLGGDRTMASLLIDEPVLHRLAKLNQLEFMDVPDPKAKTLAEVAERVRSIRITVTDSVT
ncbi:conserved hypothetical protein [Renibacterium salmoninarum ATCC 33209]|uniref:Actinobacteria/chloroflexi VLRF1 release factor domain-containing protein n=1 Tax=Renibacterium salmoninarum (strain ATCC 33209 / DSM 20767 / JCM 11484 / NBRC 15589 / NCIMB 2235) TaxID=288705 RepID=A9WSD1_RENSM|nr:acVLRF1 family peptidyl-tRNA hydrolase [Renibacterium salmoninarum]ABY23719.1 conserved hypothetical protein [Renibacterium salmoninarum ATCC 33209]